MGEGVFKCTLCREEKPLSAFRKNASSKWGHHVMCSPCQKKRYVKKVSLDVGTRAQGKQIVDFREPFSGTPNSISKRIHDFAQCRTVEVLFNGSKFQLATPTCNNEPCSLGIFNWKSNLSDIRELVDWALKHGV